MRRQFVEKYLLGIPCFLSCVSITNANNKSLHPKTFDYGNIRSQVLMSTQPTKCKLLQCCVKCPLPNFFHHLFFICCFRWPLFMKHQDSGTQYFTCLIKAVSDTLNPELKTILPNYLIKPVSSLGTWPSWDKQDSLRVAIRNQYAFFLPIEPGIELSI